MGSKVSFAKTTLSYPLFAAEFDPYNRGYLVVGGGGGESKTGVPNQIVSTSPNTVPSASYFSSPSSTSPIAPSSPPPSSSLSPATKTPCSPSAV